MISLAVGLGLILLGLYFNSLFASAIGVICLVIGIFSTKSRPVKIEKPLKKTKHTVVAGEPPASASIEHFELKGLPLNISKDSPDFLPLPDFGYEDPLDKIFLSFPVKFWKKDKKK